MSCRQGRGYSRRDPSPSEFSTRRVSARGSPTQCFTEAYILASEAGQGNHQKLLDR